MTWWRLERWTLLAVLALVSVQVGAEEPPAGTAGVPVMVEVFTSTLCPSCPGVEAKLAEKAQADPGLMIVLQNVTYWDRDGQVDPYGNADLTQRQYDYSNVLGRRPGEVFTPQPVLNGVRIAAPPLWLNWDGALRDTRGEAPLQQLLIERYETGGMAVTLPKGQAGKGYDLWVMGVHKEDNGLWRADSLTSVPARNSRVLVPARAVPNKASQALLLLQEPGPGRIVAIGVSEPSRRISKR